MTQTHHSDHDAIFVYPGITVEYHDFACDSKEFHHAALPHVMEINHCHYGRVGWNFEEGASIYMGEGDVTLHSSVLCANSTMHFPLGAYQGITINLDFDVLKHQPPQLLELTDIDYDGIENNYCMTDRSVTVPSGSPLDQIIQSLYHLPDHLRDCYLKLKTQELILQLAREFVQTKPTATYNAEVIAAISSIHKLLTDQLDIRYTISELSAMYLINTSTLKDAFKAVYGMPIATYMKEYRLKHAAKLLRHTTDSVSDIAAQVGYETASKFTKAFKEVFGSLPSDYRRA